MDCKKIKALALDLAQQAGRIQMRKFRRNLTITWKDVTDPVTEVDKACEKLIVKGITQAFPSHAILGEEGGVQGSVAQADGFTWIVDPLDGTVNYSHGLPTFCVSIGVWEKGAKPVKGKLYDASLGRPLIGVVHAPALGETFVAERGKGAWANGKPIRVSRQAKPLEAVLASGFAYHARKDGQNVREWMEVLKRFQAIRRMGSAALDLSFTAAGRFDAFWEYGLKPWDVAAGGLIVEEAGGVVSNIAGQAYQMGKPGIVASNGRLQKPLLKALATALKQKLNWRP
ncbi:MAG TPA: inositol monophosphatase family protein [bacterium]|nr:inositol monophosphatase family protein [bacterium]